MHWTGGAAGRREATSEVLDLTGTQRATLGTPLGFLVPEQEGSRSVPCCEPGALAERDVWERCGVRGKAGSSNVGPAHAGIAPWGPGIPNAPSHTHPGP